MHAIRHGFPAGAVLAVLLLTSPLFAQFPPTDLTGQVLPGGFAELSWTAPISSLNETFDADSVTGFEYDPEGSWNVEEGYLKGYQTPSWKSAWYEGYEYGNFVLESTFLNVSGSNSRGLIFRSNGGRDYDFDGYCFYIAYNAQNFALYGYDNGASELLIGWTPSDLINMEPGQSNTLSVAVEGDDIVLFINGVVVETLMDDTADSGYVGVVSSGSNEVWVDEIICQPDGMLTNALIANARQPERVQPDPLGTFDEHGTGVSRTPASGRDPVPAQGVLPMNELDEVLGYRVYRDGEMVGVTAQTAYIDSLPSPGTYDYYVTAHHQGIGESPPSNVFPLSWEPVALTLSCPDSVLPAFGGTLTYSAHLLSSLAATVPGLNYWTTVTAPGGQIVGPLVMTTFTLQPYMDVTLDDLAQNVPPYAPAGMYSFHGQIGFYPNIHSEDSFTFVKLDPYGDLPEAPPEPEGDSTVMSESWPGEEATELVASSSGLPTTPRLSEPAPNPFNASTSLTLSLPEPAEVEVTVVDVLGRTVMELSRTSYSAGEHRLAIDGRDLASGMYFLHARADGQSLTPRKLLLLR